jgi:tRNA dimethylallyltransferase
VGILEPNQECNAKEYSILALQAMQEILNKKKIPILTAGTGFYLKAFLYGMFPAPKIDSQIKEEIKNLNWEDKWLLLKEKDPDSILTINKKDIYRVDRALEMILSGVKWTEASQQREGGILELFPDLKIEGFFIEWDRKELYKRIDQRCRNMMANGLISEIETVLEFYGIDSPLFKSLGFNFALDYIQRRKSMETFFGEFSQSHRNYAKKQITWFKKENLLKHLSWELSLENIKYIEKRLINVN